MEKNYRSSHPKMPMMAKKIPPNEEKNYMEKLSMHADNFSVYTEGFSIYTEKFSM